VKKKRNF